MLCRHDCRRPAIAYAAQQLPALVLEDLEGFCALSTSSLADILCSPSLVRWGGVGGGSVGGLGEAHAAALHCSKHLNCG